MLVYCVAIFLALDFFYSSIFRGDEATRRSRVPSDFYHHGLAANFDGYEIWGEVRYRLITDSLGFKDFATREISSIPTTRRVLLIGDSFTEGIGMTFEQSFAGLLYQAGQKLTNKIEFLNAGVVSYSPTLYYKKIKYLLDRGIRFDEVVVFSDTSDVQDEATSYFCFDDDPRYHKYCEPGGEHPALNPAPSRRYLQNHFVVTNASRLLAKAYLQRLSGKRKEFALSSSGFDWRIGWSLPGVDISALCKPLGVEGGIARSKQNMGLLADMLAQHGIPMTIVVYPWPQQLVHGGLDNPQVQLWREFCLNRCKQFIDLFPAFFAAKDSRADWYEHYFILGDSHYSAAGNRLMFEQLAPHLL